MTDTSAAKVDGSALTGVSETALLTLQVRASEARRRDSLIDDPMAVELVDKIDFDFAKFGPSRRQDMALRAKGFDLYTRRYLHDHPGRPSSRSPRACRPASTASTRPTSATSSAG